MGRRSRKRRDPARATPARGEAMRRGYARGEARNEAIRQSLEPLAPGERPRAVTVAAVVALGLSVANVASYAAGVEIRGDRPPIAGVLAYSGLMLAAAWGTWRSRYWAVLGMQALLALVIVIFCVAAVFAENVAALLVAVAVVVPSAVLFWFLVKAMARIQMPDRG